MNLVILHGNVGNDPDVRYTSSGTCIAKVSVATNSYRKNKDTGESEQTTTWHRLVFIGKKAETVEKHVRKGAKLVIHGELQYNHWEGKNGDKHKDAEVLVNQFDIASFPAQPAGATATSSVAHDDDWNTAEPFGSQQ